MFFLILVLAASVWNVHADERESVEADFYQITAFDIPEELVLEPGGIDLLPKWQIGVLHPKR